MLLWYNRNLRNLPWRHTTNPYHIWLSEIILQQTRVQQGLPYYTKFTEAFPTIEALAAAPEQEVLRLWQGLGYYTRARNLHACAKQVVEQHNGHFPDNFKDLLKLPGIGRYTAAAIASFAFGEDVPVIDGNVYRVLARIFGITTDISSPSAYKEFFAVAAELIDPKDPGTFNQAIMEFGALHCTPHKPLCDLCPIQEACYAFQHRQQKELPVKKARIKVTDRFFHYFLIYPNEQEILMKRRNAKDIWRGLYDFYLYEAPTFEEPNAINDSHIQQLLSENGILFKESAEVRHQLSHQRLHAKFFELKSNPAAVEKLLNAQTDLERVSLSQAHELPKPVLIKNYLDTLKF